MLVVSLPCKCAYTEKTQVYLIVYMLDTKNIVLFMLIIILGILIGDIYFLNLQISNLLQILNDQSIKIDNLEKTIQIESTKSDLNQLPIKMILGAVVVMGLTVVFLVYGGFDTAAIADSLNISSNQVVELLNNQINTERQHFLTIIQNEKVMNSGILGHIDVCVNKLESKLKVLSSNVLNNSTSTNFNDMLSYVGKKAPVWK